MKLAFKLPLGFAAALFLMFAGATYGLYSMHRSLGEYDELVRIHVANERMAANILVNFKLQVQEWKDVLLRGKDPAKLDKGWAAFEKQERLVDQETKALLATLEEPGTHALVEQFATAHASMGNGYRKGLEAFKASDFAPTAGDRTVAGVDREPARLLGDVVEQIAIQPYREVSHRIRLNCKSIRRTGSTSVVCVEVERSGALDSRAAPISEADEALFERLLKRVDLDMQNRRATSS